MITLRTITTLERIFEKSLCENSVLENDERKVEVRRLDSTVEKTADGRRLLVLTISSYAFRVVVLFDFHLDEPTATFFSRLFRSAESSITGQALADALSEYVNMVCGTANRLISADGRSTGMSTPFVLETTCRAHVQKVNPDRVLTFDVKVGDTAKFEIVLCICVPDGATLDFEVDLDSQEEAMSGELELL